MQPSPDQVVTLRLKNSLSTPFASSGASGTVERLRPDRDAITQAGAAEVRLL